MLSRIRARNPNKSVIKSAIYGVCRRIAKFVLFTFFGGRAFHRERVPAEGALLIAANHQSFFDPPLVGCFIDQRQIAFVARAGLFKFKPFGWFISALNSIPIREDGAGDMGAIKTALAVLGAGHALVIFPEGSRTSDGAMHDFKRGAALLLKRAKCSIVPAAVEGVFDAWPIHNKLPKPFGCPVMVMYGHPISSEELMKDGADAAMERLSRIIEEMRLELRAKIRAKTGGRYPAPGPADQSRFAPAASDPAPGLHATQAQPPATSDTLRA